MDDKQEESHVYPEVENARRNVFAHWGQGLLRAAAVGGSILTLWIVVGSVWFPEWWYAAIWRGDLFSSNYQGFGWSYLLDEERWLLFCLAAIAAAAAMLVHFRPSRFLAIVDRISAPSIIVCVLLLAFDAIYLHQPRFENKADLMEVSPQAFQSLVRGLQNVRAAAPEITAPVDFHYIDSSQVSGLYSEIEPELVETERSVSAGKKVAGSASVGAGAANLKAETSGEHQETSKYERIDATAERKCVLLMNYVLKNGKAHYFTNIRDFYV
jgi:hypothetical protein